MTYEAVLFDMDGVLVSGTETVPAVYHEATTELFRAFDQPVPDEWSMALENPDNAHAFREACATWDLPPEEAWEYRERVASQLARDRIESQERTAYPDTGAITNLADQYDIGIVSNNRHDTVADCVEAFAWGDLIEVYRGRFPTLEDYDRMKPDPAYLRWAIERMDVSDCLYVGDRISDVVCAARTDCDAALIDRNGSHPDPAVEPRFYISSLSDLENLHANGWSIRQT